MMLQNAQEHGVEVHEGVHVLEVLFEPQPVDGERPENLRAVGVRIRDAQGERRDVRAKVIVDASGQAALLQNRFKLRVWDPILNKGAIWTYWKGAYRDTGRDEGATMVIQTSNRNGWFWYIPQHDDIVSVGIVAPFDYLFAPPRVRNGHEQTYQEEVEHCEGVKTRIKGAERAAGYFATRDYSYRSTTVAGDGWVLIGDAFGFLDPLYSSGVLLALRSGEMAADAIVEGLASGDTSASQLGKWGPGFNEGVDRMRRLVCEFYGGFSFGAFVRHYPELRGAVTDLLIGDLFTDRVDRVWPAMESLYKEGRPAIPGWRAGTPAEAETSRAPQLTLPDGLRP
jgi:flavin-dependent dehydrogenase